jgi:hypothetical protein
MRATSRVLGAEGGFRGGVELCGGFGGIGFLGAGLLGMRGAVGGLRRDARVASWEGGLTMLGFCSCFRLGWLFGGGPLPGLRWFLWFLLGLTFLLGEAREVAL